MADKCCSSKEITVPETTSCCSSEVDNQQLNNTSLLNDKLEFRIHGMDCPSCAFTIERGLSGLENIQEAKVNYNTAKLQVVGSNALSLDSIENQVQKLGFKIEQLNQNKNFRTYDVVGMDCGSCANSIERHLSKMPTVNNVIVGFSTGKMKVEHENSVDDIVSEVSKLGFKATLLTDSNKPTETMKNKKGSGYGLISLSGMLIALGFTISYSGIPPIIPIILYAMAIIISGYKPVKSAYYAIKSHSLDMNVLMSAAAIGAALIGEWSEGATVVWLFSLGTTLQNSSMEKTRNSIRDLMDLAPSKAWTKVGSELIQKPVEDVLMNEVISY